VKIQERPRIDAHIHLAGDDAETLALLEELDLRLLNICVATGRWREDHATFHELAQEHSRKYAWCTSFDIPDWSVSDDDYAAQVIAGLERDVQDGAVAVKAWKNIGMELARPDGSHVLIDDPIFDPIYRRLAATSVPMIMHIGEPLACWLPIDVPSPHQGYYRDHPEWHMHGRNDEPTHAELIAARDRVLERYPDLRVVGAHLGSLEHDVTEVARRLDRYPNLAVDISARLQDLMAQDPDLVRDFFISYPDRIIFGTDVVSKVRSSRQPSDRRTELHRTLRETYARYWTYLETDNVLEFDGSSSRSLRLPHDVLDRVYVENAREWFPGIEG